MATEQKEEYVDSDRTLGSEDSDTDEDEVVTEERCAHDRLVHEETVARIRASIADVRVCYETVAKIRADAKRRRICPETVIPEPVCFLCSIAILSHGRPEDIIRSGLAPTWSCDSCGVFTFKSDGLLTLRKSV